MHRSLILAACIVLLSSIGAKSALAEGDLQKVNHIIIVMQETTRSTIISGSRLRRQAEYTIAFPAAFTARSKARIKMGYTPGWPSPCRRVRPRGRGSCWRAKSAVSLLATNKIS